MRLSRWAHTYGVLPLFQPVTHRGLGGRLRRYQRRERLSLAENKRLQWRALLQLLDHAYASSPFYRRRFDHAGVRPQEISSSADFAKIPYLTREDIREHFSELRSRRFPLEALWRSHTGGTTDTPVSFLRNPDSVREKIAVQLRFNSWAGFHPGDKVFNLWGARCDYPENPSWRLRLYDRFLMRLQWAPTDLLNQEVLESYRQALNRFRPRVIYAYPTPLHLFCAYLRESRHPYHRPATAICTAEPLLGPQRRLIEEVLGCPVFEHYGSREFGMIAAECERQEGLHVNSAAAYLEFLPVEGAEIEGLHEIFVTDLLNYGMPLIRYRVNDCVQLSLEACSCGRGYPLIRHVMGRTTDVFRLPNGDVVPGVSLTNRVLQVCPGLKKVQVIQDAAAEFRVRYVPGPGFSLADLDLLRSNLRKFFSPELRWQFEPVAEIERERSGKTRFCISRVASPLLDQGQAVEKALR